ncbi:ATP-binding protein [Pedobacter sp. SL55]|uniref:ATP-binding protein n=1 Tax=Pedobacter sp. SL55 TaxID=2995161 RepID=UPI0022719F22|nr:ATP-binding protein [Pedobacter sp. SL55]WAC39026.1 ATP-binding protein [Pedobacter sp. SL55]
MMAIRMTALAAMKAVFDNKYFVKNFDNRFIVIIFDNKFIVKMRNSLGNPARGEAFYPRIKEIARIYRVLRSGVSIYLSAPRRVGKTSILRHIEEQPEENFYFVYVITESIDDSNDFFKAIFDALLKSDAIVGIFKLSQYLSEGLEAVLARVKKVYNVELQGREEPDYFELLIEVLGKVKKEVGSLVIQIDEFPQTIQNIVAKSGVEVAEKFIQRNRELRHHDNVTGNIQFIYTGSLSLFPIVEQVTQLTAINDLRTVEVSGLTENEGKDFLQKLLAEEGLSLKEEELTYVMAKLKWLIPFHLQLIAQELIEVFEANNGVELDKNAVDKAFDQVVHVRNRPQFEPYFSRLTSLFKDEEYAFVMDVLKHVALNNTIDENELNDYAVKHNVVEKQRVKNVLEGDGYLYYSQQDTVYYYTSPILQMWCKQHICR